MNDACTVLWINDGVAFFEFQVKTSLQSDPERIDDETPKPTNSECFYLISADCIHHSSAWYLQLERMSESVNFDNWMDPPHNRWAFHHVADLVKTVPISNHGDFISALPRRSVDLDDISFSALDGSTTDWNRHLRETYCDAICVIHDGHIIDERYFNGLDERSLHLLMSVTKSMTAAALGVAIGRGLVSVNDQVTTIAPEFGGTSLDGCTVRHLIDMTAGTDFVEDYDLYLNPDSDSVLIEYERQAGYRPLGNRPAIGVLKHFATYTNARPHGTLFDYRSPLTNIVARILEIVNGIPFNDVLSRDIWSPFGMEHRANILVDPLGFPAAEGGMSCSVRDLARFGLAYLNDGVVNGQTVLPQSWVQDTSDGDDDARNCYASYVQTSPDTNFEGDNWSMYHNAFWIDERNQQFSGLGIFGQYCWIHCPSRTVIARFSTYPSASPSALSAETIRGFNAVAEALISRP